MAQKAPPAIRVLDGDIAKYYTFLHPLVLLACIYYTFPSLVQNPITTLTNSLIPLGVLQAVNVAICLPSANEIAYRATAAKSNKRKSAGKTLNAELGSGAQVVPAILSLIMALTAGPPVLAAALILFGAPFTTHQFQTVLCGAHMSLLAVLPLIYTHGLEKDRWLDIIACKLPLDQVTGGALGTGIGAWLGAIPVPLDWDRDWQTWPVTVVTGAYIGHAVGRIVGEMVSRERRAKVA